MGTTCVDIHNVSDNLSILLKITANILGIKKLDGSTVTTSQNDVQIWIHLNHVFHHDK